jgi:cilia- and flagella-associated protein 251
MSNGLVVMTMFKIEKEAHPTACIWYPKVDTKEDLLLTANDDYKMKIWNVSTKNSRRTCLGPTYGGEIVKLKKLDIENNPDKFLIYSTKKKVIGLIKMPLDGNPNKTMGLIAHPSEVEDICATGDGRYMFTCGGDDLAVNMWSIDISPIDQAIALGGDGIEPFINLIDGGRDGQTYQDMKDFFYYSMIRSKDENTTKARRLNGTVPLDELPNLMRAMGYYPTQQEVDNMKDEVKFSNFAETGQHVNAVDLDTFIRLFVNHRPVYGIGKNNI